MKAVIFLAHGSRLEEANASFLKLTEKVRKYLDIKIAEAAFIEKALPSLQSAIKTCVQQGATQILVYPHFLSSGIHITKDLASDIEKVRINYPDVSINCTMLLGESPDLFDVVSRIIGEALKN